MYMLFVFGELEVLLDLQSGKSGETIKSLYSNGVIFVIICFHTKSTCMIN